MSLSSDLGEIQINEDAIQERVLQANKLVKANKGTESPSVMLNSNPMTNDRLQKSLASIALPFENVDLGNLKVMVEDPQTRSTTFSSFVSYAVTVHPQLVGVINVRRRYTDFRWLRETLVKLFPGYFVPPIPGKKGLGKFDDYFLEERQGELERFLSRLVSDSILSVSLPLRLFLVRHENSLDEGKRDVESVLFPADSGALPLSIAQRFVTLFPEACEIALPGNFDEEFLRFKEYLLDSEKHLILLLEHARMIRIKTLEVNPFLSYYNEQLVAIAKVESNFALRPDPPRTDVLQQFSEWLNESEVLPNAMKELVQAAKFELQDIQAMLEIVGIREELQTGLAKAIARADYLQKIEPAELAKYTESYLKSRDAVCWLLIFRLYAGNSFCR